MGRVSMVDGFRWACSGWCHTGEVFRPEALLGVWLYRGEPIFLS